MSSGKNGKKKSSGKRIVISKEALEELAKKFNKPDPVLEEKLRRVEEARRKSEIDARQHFLRGKHPSKKPPRRPRG